MNYLIHHGIKGQHWGIQNGPPYPLDAKTHRKVINKAKETTRKVKERVKDYRNSFDKQKAIKIGAIAAGAALTAIGGYYLYKSGALNNLASIGKSAMMKNIDLDPDSIKQTIADETKVGLSPDKIDMVMSKAINGENRANGMGRDNCASCSVSYILNRLFGGNFTALPSDVFGNKGRSIEQIESLFKPGTINKIDPTDKLPSGLFGTPFNQKLIDLIPNGSTGMLRFSDNNGNGHIANYEKTIDGIFAVVENQYGIVFEGSSAAGRSPGYKFVQEILDCSKAQLADNFDEIVKDWAK